MAVISSSNGTFNYIPNEKSQIRDNFLEANLDSFLGDPEIKLYLETQRTRLEGLLMTKDIKKEERIQLIKIQNLLDGQGYLKDLVENLSYSLRKKLIQNFKSNEEIAEETWYPLSIMGGYFGGPGEDDSSLYRGWKDMVAAHDLWSKKEGLQALDYTTDIENQAKPEQAISEAISNAFDAYGGGVGRFGKGIISSCSWLRNKGDRFSVCSHNGQEKSAGTIARNSHELFFRPEETDFTARAQQILKVFDQGEKEPKSGSLIEIKTHLNQDEKGALLNEIQEKFDGTMGCRILLKLDDQEVQEINHIDSLEELDGSKAHKDPDKIVYVTIGDDGYQVLDLGSGFDQDTLYKKFLVTGRSSKEIAKDAQENMRLFIDREKQNPNEKTFCKLQLANVNVESYQLSGDRFNFPSNRNIIALPNHLNIDQSRSFISKDLIFKEAFFGEKSSLDSLVDYIDKQVTGDSLKKIQAYNLLADLARKIANPKAGQNNKRSKEYAMYIDLCLVLKKRIKEDLDQLRSTGSIILPNKKDFCNLNHENPIFLDENLWDFEAKTIGEKIDNWEAGKLRRVYKSDFVARSDGYRPSYFMHDNYLFIDKDLYEKLKDSKTGLAVLNLMIEEVETQYHAPITEQAEAVGKFILEKEKFELKIAPSEIEEGGDDKFLDDETQGKSETINLSEVNQAEMQKEFLEEIDAKKQIKMLENHNLNIDFENPDIQRKIWTLLGHQAIDFGGLLGLCLNQYLDLNSQFGIDINKYVLGNLRNEYESSCLIQGIILRANLDDPNIESLVKSNWKVARTKRYIIYEDFFEKLIDNLSLPWVREFLIECSKNKHSVYQIVQSLNQDIDENYLQQIIQHCINHPLENSKYVFQLLRIYPENQWIIGQCRDLFNRNKNEEKIKYNFIMEGSLDLRIDWIRELVRDIIEENNGDLHVLLRQIDLKQKNQYIAPLIQHLVSSLIQNKDSHNVLNLLNNESFDMSIPWLRSLFLPLLNRPLQVMSSFWFSKIVSKNPLLLRDNISLRKYWPKALELYTINRSITSDYFNGTLIEIPQDKYRDTVAFLEKLGFDQEEFFQTISYNGLNLPELVFDYDFSEINAKSLEDSLRIWREYYYDINNSDYLFYLLEANHSQSRIIKKAESNPLYQLLIFEGLIDEEDLILFEGLEEEIKLLEYDEQMCLAKAYKYLKDESKNKARFLRNLLNLIKAELQYNSRIFDEIEELESCRRFEFSDSSKRVIAFLEAESDSLGDRVRSSIAQHNQYHGTKISEMIARRKSGLDPLDKSKDSELRQAYQAEKRTVKIASHSQNPRSDTYVRELFQNAKDACTKSGQKNINIDIYTTRLNYNKVLAFEIGDSGCGMNLDDIKNKALQPNVRDLDKIKGNDIEGEFGWGFFSIFSVAEEVDIISVKDNIETKVRLKVIKEEGQVRDIEIIGHEEKPLNPTQASGTRIIGYIKSDVSPAIEAISIANAVDFYAKPLADDMNISLQDQKLNSGQKQVAAEMNCLNEIGEEEKLTVYTSKHSEDGFERISRRNMCLSSLDNPKLNLLKYLHPSLKTAIQIAGLDLQVDIPKSIKITRTRGGLAINSQELDRLQKATAINIIQFLAKQYRQGKIAISLLPDDCLYDRHYMTDINVLEDIKNIEEAQKTGNLENLDGIDFDKYNNESVYHIYQLLVLIKQDDKKSLKSIRDKILEQALHQEEKSLAQELQVPEPLVIAAKDVLASCQERDDMKFEDRLYDDGKYPDHLDFLKKVINGRLKIKSLEVRLAKTSTVWENDFCGMPFNFSHGDISQWSEEDYQKAYDLAIHETAHYIESIILHRTNPNNLEKIRSFIEFIGLDPHMEFEELKANLRQACLLPESNVIYMGTHSSSQQTPFAFIHRKLNEMLARSYAQDLQAAA